MKEKTPDEILKNLNEVRSRIKDKETFNEIYKNKDKNIYEIITIRKVSAFRVGLFDEKRYNKDLKFKMTPTQLKFIEFVKSPNVFISCDDWFKIFDVYKDDKESLIFFDPPYLVSYNSFVYCSEYR